MLRAGYLALAIRLQEASDSLSSNELRSKISDAVSKAHKDLPGKYAYYQDHVGDEDGGDCIYNCYSSGSGDTGDTMKAPYSKGTGNSDTDYSLDTSKAVKVVPRTTYVEQPDDADHYAAMEAARLYTKGPVPLCERFVSKAERSAAGSGDFAGKNKSFPILKKEDVSAAASSIGRAGADNYSTDVIKKNIIRIAKAKGWESELPKAWQDGGSDAKEAKGKMKDCPDCDGDGKCDTCNGIGKSGDKDCPDCGGTGDCDTCDGDGEVPMAATTESRRSAAAGGLRLVESATTLDTIRLTEARADYEIKLIAPGKGSSAFYPAEVLKRDGPKVFKAGTHVYLNHATRAEESERPEGDVRNLAGVLTTDATYHESHPKGEGLYGRMKVFADHAQTVEEKAPHVGMSIRASGVAESGRRQDGLPVLKELTGAESVDVVTRAGAGGMILTESARRANTEESTMNATEKRLLESLVRESLRNKAITEGARLLAAVSLTEGQREYIMDTVMERSIPTTADGDLDAKKFREALSAELSRFGAALGNRQMVQGMGAGAPVELTEADRAAIAEREKAGDAMYTESWKTLLGTADVKVAEAAYRGRAN